MLKLKRGSREIEGRLEIIRNAQLLFKAFRLTQANEEERNERL
jgi:hypothetical protein